MPVRGCIGMNKKILTAPPSEAGFIDEKELLKRIPVSRGTAFTWVQSGMLPCVKIGRRKLFHWPSVEAALLRQQQEAGK